MEAMGKKGKGIESFLKEIIGHDRLQIQDSED